MTVFDDGWQSLCNVGAACRNSDTIRNAGISPILIRTRIGTVLVEMLLSKYLAVMKIYAVHL